MSSDKIKIKDITAEKHPTTTVIKTDRFNQVSNSTSER